MSPRRKFQPGEGSLLVANPVDARRRWGLPLVTAIAAVLMAAAITVCTVMLVSHERRVRVEAKDRVVLGYVNGFMAQFTSIDPYHANDYVNRILAQATGDFAKQYRDKANEILLQVADRTRDRQRARRRRGTVERRWERQCDGGNRSHLQITG